MRPRKRLLCIIMAALVFFGAAATASGETQETTTAGSPEVRLEDCPRYITKATNLNLRDAPDGEIVGTLPIGTEVPVLERKDNWSKISVDGETGWVWSGYLARFETNYVYPDSADEKYRTKQVVVDVSEYQGVIDWPAVAASGVWGAVIKIGDRGYSTRKLFVDPAFERNYIGAKSAGLHIGVYFYSTAKNAEDAREEARFTVRLLNEYGCELDLPVLFDEEDNTTARMGAETVRAVADAYCDEIGNADLPAGVYTYASWANEYMGSEFLNDKLFWLADWTGRRNYAGDYLLHQFTSSGTVKGISGDVDISICYFDFPRWYEDEYLPMLEEGFMLGDVDRSGRITSSDARMALRASARLIYLSGYRFRAADLDADGKITATEARRILRYSAQLERSLSDEAPDEPTTAFPSEAATS